MITETAEVLERLHAMNNTVEAAAITEVDLLPIRIVTIEVDREQMTEIITLALISHVLSKPLTLH
jgi:hypothetical protein